jgi:hypothetical protein
MEEYNMVFDVIIREGLNENKKQIIQVYRVSDLQLGKMLRNVQDKKQYIISVIPLFIKKRYDTNVSNNHNNIYNNPIDIENKTLDDVIKFNKVVLSKVDDGDKEYF